MGAYPVVFQDDLLHICIDEHGEMFHRFILKGSDGRIKIDEDLRYTDPALKFIIGSYMAERLSEQIKADDNFIGAKDSYGRHKILLILDWQNWAKGEFRDGNDTVFKH